MAPPLTHSHIVIMGVSGSGKTTVGSLLGDRLNLPYRDGDDLHPQANIEKMSQGIPLGDADRWPWLEEVGQWLKDHPEGGVIGCSSLKRSYRDVIRKTAGRDVAFVHVHGNRDLLYKRMDHRPGHFMPASLLDSQYEDLEPLDEDEKGKIFDVGAAPTIIVDAAISWLQASKE